MRASEIFLWTDWVALGALGAVLLCSLALMIKSTIKLWKDL